jgi:beta-glucosidase
LALLEISLYISIDSLIVIFIFFFVNVSDEAVKIAIMAGIDMSMVPNDYEFSDLLLQLVKEKQVSEERINEAVKRILTLKFELGLFEKSITNIKDYPDFGSKKFSDLSYEAASESITLLKNENNCLPLSKDKRVLVCGPSANSLNILNGAWTHTWQGLDTNYNSKNKSTILKAITNKIGTSNKDKVQRFYTKLQEELRSSVSMGAV